MAQSTQRIEELPLEKVMGERFSRYSKYIIQERALPDIRDGLKPVQRRILYAMYIDGNTFEHAFRKSAKSVGNVMGNFHPHGDSSIYEAMVRMSQSWKLRAPLVEMHGNNGSMDGDPPAAMRYTEARLSKIANELLQDIDKKTVKTVLNFDDTTEEPSVLPAHFPNLLVNGASGISAGYATEIPPHNLGEVIDGVIALIKKPEINLDELMSLIPGPDFPTGGILQGKAGIEEAYRTGRGKAILRAKTKIEPLRGSREQIVVSELPYEVNKAVLVKKIDELRVLKKIDGISEVRDETDRTGLRLVIELKRQADAQGILNYLFKNTDLQITYHFNMVAIADLQPQQIGLKQALSAYLTHQRDVITKRTEFDLKKAEKRQHIVDGLIRALSILDQVIKTIRASKNKKNAKENLMQRYQFSDLQADAIVSLQLYRLTNTDVTALKAEHQQLSQAIQRYRDILGSKKQLDQVIIKELNQLKKNFKMPRLTQIEAEVDDLKIATSVVVTPEDVMVQISHDGYLKRSSLRSFQATESRDDGLKQADYPIFQGTLNTLDHLFIFTDQGRLVYRPVHELLDVKWKETGQHASQKTDFRADESVLAVYTFNSLQKQTGHFVFATDAGYIKQVAFQDLLPGRTYRSRLQMVMKPKGKHDRMLTAVYLTAQEQTEAQVITLTKRAFGLHFPLAEVAISGAKAMGVKSTSLKKDDQVAAVLVLTNDQAAQATLGILTQRGAFKRMALNELPVGHRARRGLLVLRELKAKPHRIVAAIAILDQQLPLVIHTDQNKQVELTPVDYPLNDRYSNGSFVLDPQDVGQSSNLRTTTPAGEMDKKTDD